MGNTKTYKPTVAVINNSLRGKALAEKFKKNLANVVKCSSRVKPSEIKKEMTLDEVKNVYQYLTSIESKIDLKKAFGDEPPSELIAWYAHGGNAGLAWSKLMLKKAGLLKTAVVSEEQTQIEDKSHWSKETVVKAVNEELMQVTYVAMQPTVDAHGDITDVDEIRKAKENFNRSAQRANLFHMMMTDTFEVIESYIAPVDLNIDGHFVMKGSWLMTLQIHDDSLWSLVKSGEINGISIGAVATVEQLEEEND